jgi:cytochrome c553
MSEHRIVSLRNPWFTASVVTTGLLAVVAAIVGFVWLPTLQGEARGYGLWNTICNAAGLLRPAPSEPVVLPTYATTQVEVTSQMLHGANAESIGRGATLALRCTMCHGARGLSEANSPNLAGQYPLVVYKQLKDFKSGARTSAVMVPLVADLSDTDMRDLAAYYAYLPRLAANHPVSSEAPLIVMSGAPMRNVAPCGACHGGLTDKAGGPWLDGQPIVYLRTQLLAFASGARRNDISEQMRNVARQMTPVEIEAAVRYYGAQP